MLIPNPNLDFWNSDPKIHFWANLGPKFQSCPVWLKIGAQSISRMLISNPDPKIVGADSESKLRFLKFQPQNPFLGKFGPKNSELSVLSENWSTQYLKDANSESRLRFLKL